MDLILFLAMLFIGLWNLLVFAGLISWLKTRRVTETGGSGKELRALCLDCITQDVIYLKLGNFWVLGLA